MAQKTTISVIKCDVGSLAGHHTVPEPVISVGEKHLREAQESGLINSRYVFHAGDDLELLMVHQRGENNPEIHKLAWDTFQDAAAKATELKLYGAGQDILRTAFSGNVKGLGPGVAEMEIEERASDPIIVFAADKTEPGAFNYPIFRIFADPFNTAGLVIDPAMGGGFKFEVLDVLDEIPHVRLIRGVIIVSTKNAGEMIKFLRKFNAEIHVRKVVLTPRDRKVLQE